jgi:hypothetical protein
MYYDSEFPTVISATSKVSSKELSGVTDQPRNSSHETENRGPPEEQE